MDQCYCGRASSIETIVAEERERRMQIFCKNRTKNEANYNDLSQHPLLDDPFRQSDEVCRRPRYDTTSLTPSSVQASSSSLWKEPASSACFNGSNTRSQSASKDVAQLWVDMASQSERGRDKYRQVKVVQMPLQPSTKTNNMMPENRRLNRTTQSVRVDGRKKSKSSNFFETQLKHFGYKARGHPKQQQQAPLPPPPPPPLVSHQRRFRVWYGVMSDWKSAVDPKSGRVYYYNENTRETQWRKPMELASEAERKEMEEKERKQKAFFSSMEANILKTISTGQVPVKSTPTAELKKEPSLPAPTKKLVRTISSMDSGILKDLIKRQPSISRSQVRKVGGIQRLESIDEGSLRGEMSANNMSGASLGASMTLDFEMSSFDIGISEDETKALQNLARISEEMARVGEGSMDLSQLDINLQSNSNLDTSINDFTVSMSDKLDFSDRDKFMNLDKEVKRDKPEPKPDPKDIVWTPPGLKKEITKQESPSDLRGGLKQKTRLLKRNHTIGNLYLGTTMSAPDKDATIKCVCGVYRTHILGSEQYQEEIGQPYDHTLDKYRLFNDREAERNSVTEAVLLEDEISLGDLENKNGAETALPSLDEISYFYRDIFFKAQMEIDCIIMSLIYVERLIKVTGGLLRPRRSNWRSLLFSCLILSSKVWDDLSMWNADFSHACPAGVHFPLRRVNELELAILKCLSYKVKVPASEYAKYYFLLRSMLIKSGLGGDELKTMNHLDVEGAKILEQVSSGFQSMADTKRKMLQQDKLRSRSMGDADRSRLQRGAEKGGASLEHMTKM